MYIYMLLYMYMYMYMYTYTYMFAHIDMHMCVHLYLYLYTCIDIYADVAYMQAFEGTHAMTHDERLSRKASHSHGKTNAKG